MTEAEILSICHTSNHPARESGLILRRTPRRRYGGLDVEVTSRATKRASSLSILSELGVRDPERALDPPSPTHSNLLTTPQQAGKKPSKLRNFFGQRPPSELITTHLTEYFPFTEKKVLERTARNSMMRSNTMSSRRDSTVSLNPQLASRFSSSTQGSNARHSMSSSPTRRSFSNPQQPYNKQSAPSFTSDDIPRVSLSTEDGQSVDLHDDDVPDSPHVLPPIPFPTESLSQSIGNLAGDDGHRRSLSRNTSTASKRMSYMTELRSKKDRSDTASLMTVDQITADVESRRESLAIDRMAIDSNSNSEIDEWTKVDSDSDFGGSSVDEAEVEVEVAVSVPEEDSDDEDEDEDDDDTKLAGSSDEDDDTGKATTSNGSTCSVYLIGLLLMCDLM